MAAWQNANCPASDPVASLALAASPTTASMAPQCLLGGLGSGLGQTS
jgi:hypothetical protein